MTLSVRLGRVLGGVVICAGLLLGGCTKYASQGDLKRLDEAQQAAVSAEQDQQKAETDRRAIENQIAGKKAELDAAKAELEAVKSR